MASISSLFMSFALVSSAIVPNAGSVPSSSPVAPVGDVSKDPLQVIEQTRDFQSLLHVDAPDLIDVQSTIKIKIDRDALKLRTTSSNGAPSEAATVYDELSRRLMVPARNTVVAINATPPDFQGSSTALQRLLRELGPLQDYLKARTKDVDPKASTLLPAPSSGGTNQSATPLTDSIARLPTLMEKLLNQTDAAEPKYRLQLTAYLVGEKSSNLIHLPGFDNINDMFASTPTDVKNRQSDVHPVFVDYRTNHLFNKFPNEIDSLAIPTAIATYIKTDLNAPNPLAAREEVSWLSGERLLSLNQLARQKKFTSSELGAVVDLDRRAILKMLQAKEPSPPQDSSSVPAWTEVANKFPKGSSERRIVSTLLQEIDAFNALTFLNGIQTLAETIEAGRPPDPALETTIDLTRVAGINRNDSLVIRLASFENNASTQQNEAGQDLAVRKYTLFPVVPHATLTVGTIYGSPIGPGTGPNFRFSPSSSLLFTAGSRALNGWGYLYNQILMPGIGVNASLLDFTSGPQSATQYGAGVTFSLFNGLLQAGVGYNFPAHSYYEFYGVQLPVDVKLGNGGSSSSN